MNLIRAIYKEYRSIRKYISFTFIGFLRVDGGSIFEEIRQQNPGQMDEIKSEPEKELAEKFGAAPMIAPMSAVICQVYK